MKPYKSKSGKQSGVTGYLAGADFILVSFLGGEVYRYSYRSCGKQHVHNMIQLAKAQQGLATYISQHKPEFE